MDSTVRQTLCDLIAQHGPELRKDVRRCSALLKDLCAPHKREINIVLAAARERVGDHLLSAPTDIPRPALIARLTRRLSEDLAMQEEAAQWAVETWAIALDVIEPSYTRLPVPPAAAPALVSALPRVHRVSASEKVRVNAMDDAVMLWVPAGEFIMGDNDQKDNPRRCIDLEGFWIYKTPVTVLQYRRFCEAAGREMPEPPGWGWHEDQPVVNVAWQDAAAYSTWAGVLLPTEAQWEKAARGTDGRCYPWGNAWDAARCVHSVETLRTGPAPAGSLPAGASPCGALDMAGNVWQWCADWYSESYPRFAPKSNPAGPETGDRRVLRGGSWNDSTPFVFRAAMRFRYNPLGCFVSFGFRCAAPNSL